MTIIKLPDGTKVISTSGPAGAAREQELIDARHAFGVAYCRSKGWPEDPCELSIDQILEIGDQPGWKNPAMTSGEAPTEGT